MRLASGAATTWHRAIARSHPAIVVGGTQPSKLPVSYKEHAFRRGRDGVVGCGLVSAHVEVGVTVQRANAPEADLPGLDAMCRHVVIWIDEGVIGRPGFRLLLDGYAGGESVRLVLEFCVADLDEELGLGDLGGLGSVGSPLGISE